MNMQYTKVKNGRLLYTGRYGNLFPLNSEWAIGLTVTIYGKTCGLLEYHSGYLAATDVIY